MLQESHCEKVLFCPGFALSAGKWPTDGDSLYYYVRTYIQKKAFSEGESPGVMTEAEL